MSVYTQQVGITRARAILDDGYSSKYLFRYSPLKGLQDGTNEVFQIPQQRIVVNSLNGLNLFPQVYKDSSPLVFNTDYRLTDPLQGMLEFTDAPAPEDELDVSFWWTWFTDVEWDTFLTSAANNIGLTTYYTGAASVANGLPIPDQGSQPSDVADGLFTPLLLLGVSYAASALSDRYATRYDTSAGEQSFSPSQMASQFEKLAEKYDKQSVAMRDDYYKGQGTQYRPSVHKHGYVLPNFTPSR